MEDLTKSKDVVNFMEQSKDQVDWNNKIDDVKRANGGQYPSFWYVDIVTSRLVDKVLGPGSSEIRITGA